MPTGYAETHAIVRNESNTITVDQAGTGSAGTFTVTVDASSFSSDTAFGGAAGIPSITTTGSGTGQSTSHQVISGTYAGGAFTVTSETYSETGSYSVIQSTVTTYPNDGDAQTTRVDTTRSGNHTLGWSAAVGTDGQLAYTAYDFVSAEAAHSHTRHDLGGGALYETTTDAAFTVHTVGSGGYATYTGTDSTSTTVHVIYPNSGGTPFESTSTWGSSDPVSGMAYLGGLYESTANWPWNAGTATATNYTFHGVSTQNDALAETATLRAEGFGGSAIDVNSFSSTSHVSDTGHVIDDEPGTPTSGTELYHRDEAFGATTDATGSGSYLAGYANADYHATEIGTFAVANAYTVNDHTSTGTDEDGQAYSLTFNYTNTSNGSGTVTNTHDYHDGLLGLTLTGETLGIVAGSTATSRSWGTRNAESFDTPSVNVESVNRSLTIPGSAGPILDPDGLKNAFPFRGTSLPKDWMFCQLPMPRLTPVPGRLGNLQDLYNKKILQLGKDAEKRVAELSGRVDVLGVLRDQSLADPGGFAKPTATFTITPDADRPGGVGAVFAEAIGAGDKYVAADELAQEQMAAMKYKGVKLAHTTLTITYIIDEANKNPRSGDVLVQYSVGLFYKATLNGVPFPQPLGKTTISGTYIFNDGNIKTMKLK